MRLLLSFCLGLLLALPGQAQERVRNVRVSVVDSSQLDIRYDLLATRPGDSVYVQVRSRLRGALRLLPEFLQGDLGTGLTAGSDRRIRWNALANGYSLNEEIRATVLVKAAGPSAVVQKPAQPAVAKNVSTKPRPPLDSTSLKPVPGEAVAVTEAKSATVQTTQPPKPEQPAAVRTDTIQPTPAKPSVSTPVSQQPAPRSESVASPTATHPAVVAADSTRPRPTSRYVGPAWALLSAVAPGIGNIFVQLPKPKVGLRPLLTVVCYGAVAYGLLERQKSRDAYAVYDQQKNATAGEPYYQTANDHYHRYYLATRGAIVVAAADVILTFIKGIRSSQLMKEARRYQGIRIRPGIQAGQPTAVIRYSF